MGNTQAKNRRAEHSLVRAKGRMTPILLVCSRMINTWLLCSCWSSPKGLSLNPTCLSIKEEQHTTSQVFTHLGKYISLKYGIFLSVTQASWSLSISSGPYCSTRETKQHPISKPIYIPYVNIVHVIAYVFMACSFLVIYVLIAYMIIYHIFGVQVMFKDY